MSNEKHVEIGCTGNERIRFRVLRSWRSRLRGLLGTSAQAEPVELMNCWSIHTFGMHYPIDVALVGADGSVLASVRGVPPGRVISERRACLAFERPASERRWIGAGEQLKVDALWRRGRERICK